MNKSLYTAVLFGFFAFGLLLVLISTTFFDNGIWKNVFDTLATTLMISGTLGLIDQYILKNDMINFITSKVGLKKSIDTTGVTDILSGSSEIPYASIFDKTEKKIDIVHAYGQTWTRNYTDRLVLALRDTNAEIRVILMDPEYTELIKAYYPQINQPSPTALRDKLYEVARRWKEIYERAGINDPKRLKIYFHQNIQTVAMYRFDDTIICNQLHITKKPQIYNFPSIICTKTDIENDLFHVYLTEIDQLIKESRNIPIENLDTQPL